VRVRVTRGYQVTLPASLRRELGIEAGDKLFMWIEGSRIVLEKADGDVTKIRIRLGKRVDWRHVEEVVREAGERSADESGTGQ